MIENSRIVNKIMFQCNNCNNVLNCSDIYAFLDTHINIIRKKYDNSIKDIILEDQFVEDPYEHPVYGNIDYKCSQCNENLLIKIFLSAYDTNIVSFYDIVGTKPFLPFQVLKGGEIKGLILEFMFRWVHIAKWIDIVTTYIDDFGYKFLGKLPEFIYYYDPGIFINIITSINSCWYFLAPYWSICLNRKHFFLNLIFLNYALDFQIFVHINLNIGINFLQISAFPQEM